ncbi:phosphatidate cytidylyltransferase [Heyndrickxia ginsengihumi]|uniref:Phosphatidate cytidylyltransferase n=1 Tax=Heyndrickxia ginsengihumi TaxID=363870 RepID=A0A0A6VGF7_9BACI|nr:phosphatidate cytidylyltransferase [Heyndrickxia ginsengihumi]KHD86528.1 phosphatidate cytidylyltransferase [Heyndrickxia ginsengihumi]
MKQRILTAVIAAAIFIPFVIYGKIPFILLTYLMATIALYELLKMGKQSIFSIQGVLSVLLLWVVLWPDKYIHTIERFGFEKLEYIFVITLLYLSYSVLTKNAFTFEKIGFHVISSLYVGMGFHYFIEVRSIGLTYVFYALLIIWATDSGAYFVGRALGKNKLWPEISPNKTVEGALGGIICALIVAILFSVFSNMDLSTIKLLVIAVILSIFGQIGDLAESAYKRHFGVKDSGNILPGHGGILDRFDSLLFVLPLLYFFNQL